MKSQLEPRCPIRTTLEMLGGKWRLLLIHQISLKTQRYGNLKKAIPEISEKMLTQELKYLVENGLISRKSYGEVPPRVEYRLTDRGVRAAELIEPIATFGKFYNDELKKD